MHEAAIAPAWLWERLVAAICNQRDAAQDAILRSNLARHASRLQIAPTGPCRSWGHPPDRAWLEQPGFAYQEIFTSSMTRAVPRWTVKRRFWYWIVVPGLGTSLALSNKKPASVA